MERIFYHKGIEVIRYSEYQKLMIENSDLIMKIREKTRWIECKALFENEDYEKFNIGDPNSNWDDFCFDLSQVAHFNRSQIQENGTTITFKDGYRITTNIEYDEIKNLMWGT